MELGRVTVLQCYSVTVLHYQRLHNETPLLLDQLGVDQYNQEIQLEIQNETQLFDPQSNLRFPISSLQSTLAHTASP